MTTPKLGGLQIWWVPQIPGESFTVPVESVEQGRWLCGVLADYDLLQFRNDIKPDYSNAGGVQVWEDNGNDNDPSWWDSEE